MNRKLLVLSSIAAAGVVAACDEKTSNLGDTVRPNAYGFQMVSSATNLPRASVRFRLAKTVPVVPESIVVEDLRGLDSLGSGYWTAWIGDSLGTAFTRATGELTVVRQDTTLNALGQPDTTLTTIPIGNVSGLSNGGPNQTWTWIFTRTGSGVGATDSMQTFMITMEDVPNATVPGSRKVMWTRRGDGVLTAPDTLAGSGVALDSLFRTSGLRFGNYGSTSLTEYVFSATPARGRGYFQRQVLSVNDSTLARPPIGYYYAVWAVGEFYKPSDTLFVGDLRSPWPRRHLSLYDADSIRTDPEVVLDVPPSIWAGAIRISGDTLGFAATFPYQGYAFVRLTIEPKAGIRGRMGVNRILQASVPFLIFTGGIQ